MRPPGVASRSSAAAMIPLRTGFHVTYGEKEADESRPPPDVLRPPDAWSSGMLDV